MVTRVFGKVNDKEISLTKISEDKWEVEIPPNLLGQYYVDLYAEDDAGNIAFMTKALFEVDPFGLCTKFKIVNDFESEISKQCYDGNFSINDYQFICKEVRCVC